MFVEDILVAISNKLALGPSHGQFGGLLDGDWYRSFISSVTTYVQGDRPLSTNQSRMILKLVAKVKPHIVNDGLCSAYEIGQLLTYPQHRQPPYESSQIPREARYLGDNLLGLRCKADGILAVRIKNLAVRKINPTGSIPRFDWPHKIWIVPVHRYNLCEVQMLLREHRFHLDNATTIYLDRCHRSANSVSTFMLADHEPGTLIASIHDNDILAGWVTEVASGITL
jgi:hypothetical protein